LKERRRNHKGGISLCTTCTTDGLKKGLIINKSHKWIEKAGLKDSIKAQILAAYQEEGTKHSSLKHSGTILNHVVCLPITNFWTFGRQFNVVIANVMKLFL